MRLIVSIILGLLSFLSGCARSPFDSPYTHWPSDDSEWRSLRQRLAADTEPIGDESTPAADIELSESGGPEEYVQFALQRSPAIRAARHRVAMLAERVPQARSLDDPMAMVAPVGEMAETAAGMVGVMASVSQKLPTPGKLDTRGRVAAQDVAMAVQELNDVALRVAADTRRAYWSLYFAARATEVTEQNRKLLDQFRRIAEAKLAAGQATQADVLRASVEQKNLDNELIALRQRRESATAMLNRMMDRSVTAALPAPAPIDPGKVSLDIDRLLREATASHPQMQKVREKIEGYRQRQRLAALNRWPDLTLGLSYSAVDEEGLSMAANGDDQWWLSIGFNLPIWSSRLDAAEREAQRGVWEGLAELSDAHNRVAFSVRDALARVEADQKQVELFVGQILPESKQTVEAAMSGYQTGKVDFLTLVDNWRRQLQFELMYQRSLSQMEQDLADLQQAVGRDLGRREGAEPTPSKQDNPPKRE